MSDPQTPSTQPPAQGGGMQPPTKPTGDTAGPPAKPGAASGAKTTGTSGKTEGAEPGKKAGDTSRGADSDPLRRSRAGGFYVAVVGLAVVLVLLTIFIFQNTEATTVRFLTFEGETPVAVALLAATAAGIFLASIAASLRILQLRRRVKADRKQ